MKSNRTASELKDEATKVSGACSGLISTRRVWHHCGTERIPQRRLRGEAQRPRETGKLEDEHVSPLADSEQGGHVLATIFWLVPAAITTGLTAFPLPKFLTLSLYQGYLLLAVTGEN